LCILNNRHIALFIPAFGGGGAENVFTILANHWVSEGFVVDYLVCSGAGPMRARLDPRVNVIELANRGGLLFRRLSYSHQISKYCKRTKPSLLLSTLTYCNQSALIAKCLWGLGEVTLIVREANSLANQRKASALRTWMNLFSMRLLYPQADWVSANSDYTLDELEDEIGVPKQKRALVRNPVVLHDIERTNGSDVPMVLGCGRLIPQKDFETLIRAVALVRKARPCRLVIVGEGPERDNLEALAQSLELNVDAFELAGFVDDTEQYYRGADVFVLPSKWEGLPNVVLEALSYDLPVVATDCSGGTREIFTEAPEDHLVAVSDVEKMAARIVDFLERPPESGSMQAILSGRYDVSTIASSYCQLAERGTREVLDV